MWAGDEWLHSVETLEAVPIVSWTRSILVHPTAVVCILRLMPSISVLSSEKIDAWAEASQYYMSLILKALLRSERNQQTMCSYDTSRYVLEVGEHLFKSEKHPLLLPFHYILERLASHAMQPRELRYIRWKDEVECLGNFCDWTSHCVVPIWTKSPKWRAKNPAALSPFKGSKIALLLITQVFRVKALASMLTPRNHVLIHPPAFVEFDLAIEGFASCIVPSLAYISSVQTGTSSNNERLFPPLNGLTLLSWFYVDQWSEDVKEPIRLCTIVRNYDGSEASRRMLGHEAANIENHLTCFYIQLSAVDRSLLVSTAEHSMLDELRRDFKRPNDSFVHLPLSEQFFHTRTWNHIAVVLKKSLLKHSEVEVGGGLGLA